MVHVYNGILLSHKKDRNWAICRDVDGPTVCQSEGCQKAKNKYRILMHVCGIDKDGTDEPIYRNRMKT